MKKKQIIFLLVIVLSFLLVGCKKEQPKEEINGLEVDEYGYVAKIEKEVNFSQDKNQKVKNIILILGDGMGFNQIEVTRRLIGAERKLDLDTLTNKGEIETSCLDHYVTDSSAAATAYATGIKTIYERAGRDKDGNDLKTILDYCHEASKGTGVVTDKELCDGTPLGFTAHLDNRYTGTYDIGVQQIKANVDVLFGSGFDKFKRHKDLMDEYGYEFIKDYNELMTIKSNKIIGAFSTLNKLPDTKGVYPTLCEMADKAIKVLSQNKEGFFLLIESGQIDNYCGDGNIKKMAEKVVVLDQVLRISMNFAKENPETLIIVLADHETGGLVIKDGEPSIDWFTEATRYHTPVNVPLFAYGMNSDVFNNKILDNTEVFDYMMNLMGLEK